MPRHDHPLFTRLYTVIARVEDAGAVGQARSEVLSELSGRVLIVGLGTAADLHHLPAAVTEVVAVEPSASMRHAAAAAVQRARDAGVAVEVLDAVGEDLPLPDGSVDAAVLAYVMCSVDDPDQVVSEVRRVLRPGGTVAVLEHVAGPPGSTMRRLQRAVSPVWRRVAAGCHPDRDTRSTLAAGGFDVTGLVDFQAAPVPPVSPGLKGLAVLPGESR